MSTDEGNGWNEIVKRFFTEEYTKVIIETGVDVESLKPLVEWRNYSDHLQNILKVRWSLYTCMYKYIFFLYVHLYM